MMMGKQFGSRVPWGEPSWYNDSNETPYYSDEHKAFRAQMRKYVDEKVSPNVHKWEKDGIPISAYQDAAKVGLLQSIVGWPEDVPGLPPRPKGYDGFFMVIAFDELCRCASGGVVWGLTGALGIGLPPIVHYGSPEMQRDVVIPCLLGTKRCALAVSEATAGSDVARLKASAVDVEGEDCYLVNGLKKWITGGMFADYFTVAVRLNNGKGMKAIHLILVEKTRPGVSVRKMDCMGGQGSGTAYVEFDDVKVPKKNKICNVTGLLQNFVTERLGIAMQATRFSRVCLEESIQHAKKRSVFGKTLMEQPVVRYKLAEMARHVVTSHTYLESLAFRLTAVEKKGGNFMNAILGLGAEAMLCKVQATRTFEYCARTAAHIHGGQSYVKGNKIENLYRHVLSLSIPGGSEDVMLDSAARLSLQGKM